MTNTLFPRIDYEFKDDKFHGHGTYTHVNGEILTGLWKDGDFIIGN